MEMYADYVKETLNCETLLRDYGFAVYQVEGEKLFITDFYIKPAERTARNAKALLDELEKLGRVYGCVIMYGFVAMNNMKKERALGLYTNWGAFIVSADSTKITIAKEISNG